MSIVIATITFILGFTLGAVGGSLSRQSHQIDDIQDKLDWLYEHAECGQPSRHA